MTIRAINLIIFREKTKKKNSQLYLDVVQIASQFPSALASFKESAYYSGQGAQNNREIGYIIRTPRPKFNISQTVIAMCPRSERSKKMRNQRYFMKFLHFSFKVIFIT